MQWKKKQPPKLGDRRTKRRFLFFPKTILDITRWLEWAEWQEELIHKTMYNSFGNKYFKLIWIENFWTD